MTIVIVFVKIISIPDGEVFSETTPFHTLSKLYDVPVGFVAPPPHSRQCIALYAVAEGWLLLDVFFPTSKFCEKFLMVGI